MKIIFFFFLRWVHGEVFKVKLCTISGSILFGFSDLDRGILEFLEKGAKKSKKNYVRNSKDKGIYLFHFIQYYWVKWSHFIVGGDREIGNFDFFFSKVFPIYICEKLVIFYLLYSVCSESLLGVLD